MDNNIYLNASLEITDAFWTDFYDDTFTKTDVADEAKDAWERALSLCEEYLYEQIEYYAFLQLKWMTLKNDWALAGKSQCEDSFLRVVLKLGPMSDISYMQRDTFQTLLSDTYARLNLAHNSFEEVDQQLDAFRVVLGPRSFGIHQFETINLALARSGSDWVLQGGVYGPYPEFILGEGFHEHRGDYDVYFLSKEIMRSPTTIMAMAAMIGDETIFVRDEALLTIFEIKWMSFADMLSWPVTRSSLPDAYISECIRRQVMAHYGVVNRQQLLEKQDTFVADIKETVLAHELGHGVIQYHYLDEKTASRGEASKMLGDTVIIAILEYLADFAPKHGDVMGPMLNLVQISKTDENRATRMFWMYFSDTWFFDTPDEYMYLYSELVAVNFALCVNADLSINWTLLAALITGENNATDWMCQRVGEIVSNMCEMAESAAYYIEDKAVDMKTWLAAAVEKELLKHPYETEANPYQKTVFEWSCVWEYLLKNEAAYPKLETYLNEQADLIRINFFTYLKSQYDIQTTEDTLKTFIENKMMTCFSTDT